MPASPGLAYVGRDYATRRIDDADLTDADLTGADLTHVLLTGASWSAQTKWPDDTIAGLIASASQPIDGNRFRIGELRAPG